MGGKGIYDFNYSLLFNIQLLCFIKPIWIDYFFNKIKNNYDCNENTKLFFNYFSRNWLNTKYPIKLWNFYEKLKDATKNEKDRYITTNNLNENINRYLNNALIKSRVSYEDFIYSLSEVEKQFTVKVENAETKNAKSKIILFYLDKMNFNSKKELKVLTNDEIKEIKLNYLNSGLESVNAKINAEEDEVDIEHIAYNSENNLDEDKSSEEEEIINDNI